MEMRRKKATDVEEFAKRMILSPEYRSTLKRRVFAGEISHDFARTLLGYARSSEQTDSESRWLSERPAIEILQKIAGSAASQYRKEHET
jgi:hypothetical protein